MSQLVAVARVLRDRLAEIDREIKDSSNERERIFLWRARAAVRQLCKAMIERHEKNLPG